MKITRNGTTASVAGPAEWFTGTTRLDQRFSIDEPSRLRGLLVTFEPGARTHWHTHPLGQLLIVTSGLGWAQTEGEPIQEIRPGDIIWFHPGELHWHGASDKVAMSHIAVQEAENGKTVDWAGPVTDAQYFAGSI